MVENCPDEEENVLVQYKDVLNSECSEYCDENTRCAGFSYDKITSRCILKSKACFLAEGFCSSENCFFQKKDFDPNSISDDENEGMFIGLWAILYCYSMNSFLKG